jgi:hypothetical protein
MASRCRTGSPAAGHRSRRRAESPPCAPSTVGATMRVSTRKRVWLSVIVSGSIRRWSCVRNHPLKSAAHSSLAASAAMTRRGASRGRRRRRDASTKPARFRMSPIVEAAGQPPSPSRRSSSARSLRGPKCGNRRRKSTTAASTRSHVRCKHERVACEPSMNQASPPPDRRARQR